MVLYTIIDPELIASPPDLTLSLTDKEYRDIQVIDYEGVRLEVVPEIDKSYTVNRIISTDPADYLKPWLQPGSKIHLTYNITDHR